MVGLDLPGSKVVYGSGPLVERLQRAYPAVHWRGLVPRSELPRICSTADVFVFPGRSETFGLVIDGVGRSRGGVLRDDLREAALLALGLPRAGAVERARRFDWQKVCDEFEQGLVHAGAVTPLSQKLHKLGA